MLLWTFVYKFLCVFISLGYIPRSEIAGSYDNAVLNLLKNRQMFSKVAEPFYIPTSSV